MRRATCLRDNSPVVDGDEGQRLLIGSSESHISRKASEMWGTHSVEQSGITTQLYVVGCSVCTVRM